LIDKALTYDGGKEPLANLPWAAIDELSRVQQYGAEKYKDFNNYRKGMEVTRNLSCALRHIRDYLQGKDLDHESGCNPLGHALCRIAFVLENLAEGTAIDDRFKPAHLRADAQHQVETFGPIHAPGLIPGTLTPGTLIPWAGKPLHGGAPMRWHGGVADCAMPASFDFANGVEEPIDWPQAEQASTMPDPGSRAHRDLFPSMYKGHISVR
jgi:hypothetical protein